MLPRAGEIEARIREADFIVAGLLPVTATHLAAAVRLKGVVKHGVGTENIDVGACSARGVPVRNAPAPTPRRWPSSPSA